MRDRSDWPLVPVNRLYKSPPTAACWRLPVVEQAIPLAMAERVEVIVDFSAYPFNTTVTLDDQNAPLAERSVLQFIVVRKVRESPRPISGDFSDRSNRGHREAKLRVYES